MKKHYLLLITICILSFKAGAQKRNNIKIIGIGFDNMITSTKPIDDAILARQDMGMPFVLNNTFNWGFGFERLIGNRIVLGVNYWKYFAAQTDDINVYYNYWNSYTSSYTYNFYYQPISNPHQFLSTFNYKTDGFNIGLESKYYFSEHDEDGANGVYLASSYQLCKINHEFVSTSFIDTASSGASAINTYQFTPTTTYVNRLGLKLGVSASSVISTDFYLGFNYALPANFNENYIAPITARKINFYIGWQIGVPF